MSPAAGPDEPSAAAGALRIRPATVADAPALRRIYNREVETSTSTFDLVSRSLADQERWISERTGAFAALVGELHGEVAGFSSLSPYKERAAYRTTVEDSIYVDEDHQRMGVGRQLLGAVLDVARHSGFHTVIARIESTRDGSVALHQALGFEIVGTEREVGRKFNRWLDVTVMQRLL
jgi:L-amino acid N-acyltransferase